MSELSIAELERIATAETGRDYARERRETAETLKLCDEIEALDKEHAADAIEEVLAPWNDPLTGLPPEGMESPRFRSQRQASYIDWIYSGGGARTRALVHPELDDRLQRQASETRGAS